MWFGKIVIKAVISAVISVAIIYSPAGDSIVGGGSVLMVPSIISSIISAVLMLRAKKFDIKDFLLTIVISIILTMYIFLPLGLIVILFITGDSLIG